MRVWLLKITFLFIISVLIASCNKDEQLVYPDNEIPAYNEIPDILIQNYINRMFIDLIGREPKNDEMTTELNALKTSELSTQGREALAFKLQTDTNFIVGDSSYFIAYHNRLYESGKARMLEGVPDQNINGEIGVLNQNANTNFANGNMVQYQIALSKIQNLENVLNIPFDYRSNAIDIEEVYFRFLYNVIYDEINMNSFNFINASFDDIFFRFPSQYEFDESYEMVEYDQVGLLFGQYGQTKGDYTNILTSSNEFYEGMIVWTYKSLLSRNPTTDEIYFHIQDFIQDKDLQKLQRKIVITDEYANF